MFQSTGGVLQIREVRKPRAGIVITGNEVYYGRIKDAFAPVIASKIKSFDGEVVGIYFAPDDKAFIERRLRELIEAGADLRITTGGMSVDPDDVTRFAIRNLGVSDIAYGSAMLPGAMFLVAYVEAGVPPASNPHSGGPGLRHVCQNNSLRPGPSAGACRRANREA